MKFEIGMWYSDRDSKYKILRQTTKNGEPAWAILDVRGKEGTKEWVCNAEVLKSFNPVRLSALAERLFKGRDA